MSNIFVHGFYGLSVLFILIELTRFGGFSWSDLLKRQTDKAKAEKEQNEERLKSNPLAELESSESVTAGCMAILILLWMMLYTCWTVLGIFSSQFILFLALLIIAGVTILLKFLLPKYAPHIDKLDAFISVLCLIAIILNKYHYHIVF